MKKHLLVLALALACSPALAQTNVEVAELAVSAMRDRAKQCFVYTRTTAMILEAKSRGTPLAEVLGELGPNPEAGMVEAAKTAYAIKSILDDRVMQSHFNCLDEARNRLLKR